MKIIMYHFRNNHYIWSKVKIDSNRLCFEKELVKSKHDRISKQSPADSQLLVESQPDINKRKFDKVGFEFWRESYLASRFAVIDQIDQT